MTGVSAPVVIRASAIVVSTPIGIVADGGMAGSLSRERRGTGGAMLSARLREQQHGDDEQCAHAMRGSPECTKDIHVRIFGSFDTSVKGTRPELSRSDRLLQKGLASEIDNAPLASQPSA